MDFILDVEEGSKKRVANISQICKRYLSTANLQNH